MKLTITYIILIFSAINLYSTDVRIVNSSIKEYPERTTEIYFLSDDSKPILNLDKSLLEFEVDGNRIDDYSLTTPSEIIFNPVSVVISIDNSLQNEINIELIKRVLKRISKDLLTNDIQIAIQSYNSSSFLLQDYTNDVSKLDRAINNITFRSVSNYNTAFLNRTTGSLEIANRTNRKSLILNLTSGNSIGDSNSISSKANDYGVAIYNYVFSTDISKNLSSISTKTNGKYFAVDDEEMFYSHLLHAIFKEAGVLPYRLNYNYTNCDTINALTLKYNVLIRDNYKALYPKIRFPYIEVFPNSIDFGVVEPGKEESMFLTLIARNANILLQDIIYDNSIYEITPTDYIDRTLQNSSPNIFTLKLKSNSTDYNYSKIEFVSDACIPTSVDVFNGKKEGNSQETDLKVISPNGNETFFQGQYIDLQWDGVISTQQVLLEYSSNNGSNWNTISEEGVNKKHKWLVPEIDSEEMLFRVGIPSGNIQFDKVSYVTESDRSKKIKKAVLSNDNKFAAVSFLDGSIFTWNLEKGKIETQLRDKNLGINTSDIEFGINTSLIAAAFGKNEEYNIVVWDAEDPTNTNSRSFNSKVNDIEWSDDGTTLYIALSNGNLVKWDIAGSNVITLTSFSNEILSISINHIKNIIGLTTDKMLYLAGISGDRLDSISINGIFDLEWNNSGTKIFAVYDFSDLRLFSITGQNGNYKLNQDPRIVRNQSTNLTNAEWTSNNSVLLQSNSSNILEHWNTDNTKIKDIDIHKKAINSSYANGKMIISSIDTNTALVWNIDDYPFVYRTLDSDISDKTWSIKKKEVEINNIDLGNLCLTENNYFKFDNVFINKNAPSITIDSINSLSNEIRVINTFPKDLGVNKSLELKLNYSPISSGIHNYMLYIYYGNKVDTITVSSNIIKSNVSVINNEIEFINTLVNSSKSINKEILINNSNSIMVFNNAEFILGADVFSIVDDNLDGVNIGEKLFFEVNFQPKSTGYYSGLIKLTSDKLCSPLFVELIGNAVKSNIQLINKVDFGIVDCEKEHDTTIYIRNLSEGSIEILESNLINGNSYQIDVDLPFVIQSKDSIPVNIKFVNSGVGTFQSTLEFITNLTGDDNKLSIDIIGQRDTVNLALTGNRLDFGTIGTNTNSIKTIKILNNSNIDFTFDFPLIKDKFKLTSAIPKTIGKGDTSEVTFEFTGNDRDTTIEFDFNYGLGCNSDFKVPLSVIVSNGIPIIGFNNLKDLGIINCSTELIFDIKLYNVGSNNLIIDSLYFDGVDSKEFRVNDLKVEYIILPNDSITIEIIYTPNELGNISSDLVVKSNASNSIANLSTIRINAFQNNTMLELLDNRIEFEGLRSNKKYSQTLTLKNTGNTSVNTKFINDIIFEVDSIRPEIIAPEESATVFISFLGGEINTQYNGIIIIYDDCDSEYPINLTADVGGSDYISIRPESIIATTGTNVDLTIMFTNNSGIDLPLNDTISTKLILSSSIVAPVDAKHFGTIINGERIIELKIPLTDETVLYKIPMRVTLGDTSFSEIRLVESTHLENGFYIEDIEKGSITVTNIVTTPTDRYIQDNGRAYMSETIPSPVEGISKIEYRVIEFTNVSITIYDILGNKIEELVNKYHEPGEYSIEISPQNLSSGNYLYKLETPSMEIIKKMTIIR
ncbi:MAG: VWA domain-containing protein [Candidatus Kapaibacterium sp.]